MSTSAQIAANIANAQLSTGARTPEGHAVSSRNATTHGLFTKSDFIRPGEEDTYAQAKSDLESSHSRPQGPSNPALWLPKFTVLPLASPPAAAKPKVPSSALTPTPC